MTRAGCSQSPLCPKGSPGIRSGQAGAGGLRRWFTAKLWTLQSTAISLSLSVFLQRSLFSSPIKLVVCCIITQAIDDTHGLQSPLWPKGDGPRGTITCRDGRSLWDARTPNPVPALFPLSLSLCNPQTTSCAVCLMTLEKSGITSTHRARTHTQTGGQQPCRVAASRATTRTPSATNGESVGGLPRLLDLLGMQTVLTIRVALFAGCRTKASHATNQALPSTALVLTLQAHLEDTRVAGGLRRARRCASRRVKTHVTHASTSCALRQHPPPPNRSTVSPAQKKPPPSKYQARHFLPFSAELRSNPCNSGSTENGLRRVT